MPALAESQGDVVKQLRKKRAQQQEQVQPQQKQVSTQPVFGADEPAPQKKKKSEEPLNPPAVTNYNSGQTGGRATTETEVVIDKGVAPLLSTNSSAAMQAAVSRYENIVASGGWEQVPSGRLSKGNQGKEVALLKRRLVAEGYLPSSTLEGEKGVTFTTAVEQALKQFQINHGLAASGKLDKATIAELNVPAATRLATLRANLPRVAEYSKDLGPRYIVVNIPQLQLEAVQNGRVFSRHNVIAGKPERPSPIVMTNLSDINFNPFWNVPVSIVERDLYPQIMRGGPQILRKQNIRIYDGYQGPEVDAEEVDWSTTPPERYHFRQDPGPENAMATVKINFPSPFGVYMHDTPTRNLFGSAARYLSSGCVRIDKVPILVNWILNGQEGWSSGRIAGMAESLERLDVKLIDPPQVRWVYLTAWATNTGQVNFRKDIYELDGSGFVVGQPMPVGEYSDDGQRYVLKPIPRTQAASPVDSLSDDSFDLLDDPDPAPKQATAKQKPKPSTATGNTTVQQGTPSKNKPAASETKTAAKSSGKTTFEKAQEKAAQRKGNVTVDESPEELPKVIKKKKKKAVEAATVTDVDGVDEIFGQD
jgi:hypothetical protein